MKFSINHDQAGHRLLDMSNEELGIIIKFEIRREVARESLFNSDVTISLMKEDEDSTAEDRQATDD